MEPRIIGIVTSANHRDPEAMRALSHCDAAELRADGMQAADVIPALRALRADRAPSRGGGKREIFLTIRLKRDGGAWDDARAREREELWGAALADDAARPDWIDVEMEELQGLSRAFRDVLVARGCKVLLSRHDFKACPPDSELRGQLAGMRAAELHGLKLAATCATRAELLRLLAFARAAAAVTGNAGVFSMGKAGRASRALAPLLGCPYAYGYLTGGAVAPGQLSARELADFHRDLPQRDWAATPVPELLDWAEARVAGGARA